LSGLGMNRTTKIGIDFHSDIEQAKERFGDHEDMSEARIIRWLQQFQTKDLQLAAEVIRSVRYINGLNIRTMTKQLFQIAVDELNERGCDRAAFVPVGDHGSGSGMVARVLRDLVRPAGYRMLSMVDVSKLSPDQLDAIVFIDDFSGTGKTLEEWWENVEPLVRPANALVFVGVLVLNERARERIANFASVLAVEELGPTENILSEESRLLSSAQKGRLRHYCHLTGCASRFEEGFEKCGLLLAFKHGCPNNSLPILWCNSSRWNSLFNRRAI